MRTSRTYAVIEVSPAVYAEIAAKLRSAGYDQAFLREDDGEVIDMQGIALLAGVDVAPTG